MVQRLRLHAANAGTAWVQSLVGEVPHAAQPEKKKKRERKKISLSLCFSGEPQHYLQCNIHGIKYLLYLTNNFYFYPWLLPWIPDLHTNYLLKISIWKTVGFSNHTMHLSQTIAFHLSHSHLFSSSLSIPPFSLGSAPIYPVAKAKTLESSLILFFLLHPSFHPSVKLIRFIFRYMFSPH